jgi:hypothetical protein
MTAGTVRAGHRLPAADLAVTAPGLHAGSLPRRPGTGLTLSMTVTVVALIAVRAGLKGPPAARHFGGLQ